MNKNQLKKAAAKECLVIMAFALIGIAGHLIFPYLYKYYIHHFSTRSDASYSMALSGWWFLIAIGYFLSFFVRRS